MNTFGRIFRLTDFGETHGGAIGGVVDGCPAGLTIDFDFIRSELERRATSGHYHSTRRSEPDHVEFLSGIHDGKTLGSPIAFLIRNRDVVVNEEKQRVLKPSHASYTYMKKYHAPDNRFCGRASARQTACRVVAGAIAKLILRTYAIDISASIIEEGVPSGEGDTFGAKVKGVISNLPPGLGEPVYDKFHARLGYAMLSINACKGFEIGKGFDAAKMCGSQYNDLQNSDFSFVSNHDGGVQGGITNGQDVAFNVAFKPVPSIQQEQSCIDFEGRPIQYTGSDRNDLCVTPRVLPIVEAMAALVTVDFLFIQQQPLS